MTTVLESINQALHHALEQDERVYLLGEDILDPYGGAFKASQGLSTRFPERVKTTPISEAAITGIAAGMALRGLFPVVEIMFGDFTTLIADQLINHIAKFRWMYNQQVSVPLVIRTPMGGRRGYGPTHSQTLEKLFLGIPGLQVIAPTALGNPGELLYQAILQCHDPVLFIENKLLYSKQLVTPQNQGEFLIKTLPNSRDPLKSDEGLHAPTYSLTVRGAPTPKLTLVTYGYMAELARQAALDLAYQYEIFVEILVPTRLAPYTIQPIIDSTHQTGRLLVAEEGTLTAGWGAEILARVVEVLSPMPLKARRLAACDLPIPASGPLEEAALPSSSDIVHLAAQMV